MGVLFVGVLLGEALESEVGVGYADAPLPWFDDENAGKRADRPGSWSPSRYACCGFDPPKGEWLAADDGKELLRLRSIRCTSFAASSVGSEGERMGGVGVGRAMAWCRPAA